MLSRFLLAVLSTCALPAIAGLPAAYLPPQRIGPLVTGDGAIGDRFGLALAHDGTTVVVGARQVVLPTPDTAEGLRSGAAFVYVDMGIGFTSVQRLQPPDPAEDDLFGQALAVSGDLIVVGAPGADRNRRTNVGAAYVYQRAGSEWVLDATLLAPDRAASDTFGDAVAIGGDTLWVSAPGRALDTGVVFGFRKVAGVWTVVATLQAAQPAAGERFGERLAASTDLLLVGVPRADVGALVDAGAVDRFLLVPNPGMPQRLLAPVPATQARFGSALRVAPSAAFVGAAGDLATTQGRVHAFTRSGAALVADGELSAADGAPADGFGASLDVAGDTLLIGAPSRVFGQGGGYVFTRGAGGWTQRARLEDFSEPEGGGLTGTSAALIGGRALLGADLAKVTPNRSQGLVRVWRGSAATWTPEPRLDRADGAAGEFFGFSVAIDGPRLVVGSFLDDTIEGGDDAGSATLFERGPTGWTRRINLVAPDGDPEDWFGRAVAIDGDLMVVGAPRDIFGATIDERGAAYAFRRNAAGDWTFVRKFTAPDADTDDAFGFAVGVSGDRVVVAAPGRDDGAPNRGGAYAWSALPDGSFRFDGKLTPSQAPDEGFAGIALAIDAGRVVLGAPEATVDGRAAQGVAILFDFNGSAWVEGSTVLAADGVASDRFAGALALEPGGGRLAVGASGVSQSAMARGQGAAYVFRVAGAPVQEARLQAVVQETGAGLGSAISLRDDRLLVGASAENTAGVENVGRVHRFERIGGTWQAAGTLDPTGAPPFTFFGRSIAADFGVAAIGGPLRAGEAPAEGSVEIFADADALLRDGFE